MKTIQRSLVALRGKLAILVVLVIAISLAFPLDLAQASGNSLSTLGVVQQWSLSAPSPAPLDEFGYSVAMDGNTVVVGARYTDTNLGGGPIPGAGAVYVYTHNGKSWNLDSMLAAGDAAPYDSFGVSVAIRGNTILVGATGVTLESGGETLDGAGAAYVFTRSGDTWVQQSKITASDPAEDDAFGSAVAIYGRTVAIAAETKDFYDVVDVGAVYVFNISGRNWQQRAKLIPSAPFPGYYFGSSLAIQSSLLAVGSSQFYPVGESGTGLVNLYRPQGDTWVPAGVLEADDGRPGDDFGSALAFSGSTLVVGADHADPYIAGRQMISAGAAYIFSNSKGSWQQVAKLVADDGSDFYDFGSAVGVDGSTVVVGAGGATQAGEYRAGAVYIFEKVKGEWTFQTRAVTDPVAENDLFGKSVAIDGGWFVAGASGRSPQGEIRAGEAFVNLLGSVQLPETGFAPSVTTVLPAQPAALAYHTYSDMWLEIPSLDQELAVVGVPRTGDGWDVRWLEGDAGYLEGTAFPTWAGNSGLAAHATSADGGPGPFSSLGSLKWGDSVIIHAWGQRYIYEVRQNSLVAPAQAQVLNHESLPWLTLITCQGYDETLGSYRWRRVVRAVLVSIDS